MPMMITGQPEGDATTHGADKRHFTHKRLERWIRLQQFVYGLPDDYAYAVCTTERAGGAESRALVTVGWLTWFGHGKGTSRQHALALALLDASEALTSNSTRVFWHGLSRWVWRRLGLPRATARSVAAEEQRADERLAG
jgi:hypothetical protein